MGRKSGRYCRLRAPERANPEDKHEREGVVGPRLSPQSRLSSSGSAPRRLEAGKRAGPPIQGLFGIKVEKERGSTVLRVCGELDLASAMKFDAAIQDAEENGGPIVVDLSEVTFVDSTGLGTLLRARRRERQDGGDLLTFILSPHEPVKLLLRMTGADVLLS